MSLSDEIKRRYDETTNELATYYIDVKDVQKAVRKLKEKIKLLNRNEELELSYVDEIFGDKLLSEVKG